MSQSISIAIAFEDDLSKAIIQKILSEAGKKHHLTIECVLEFSAGGCGYLFKNMKKWIDYSEHNPLFLLTDLDKKECPVLLKNQWFNNKKSPQNFLFRIAIKEVESWLLADKAGFMNLIGYSGVKDYLPDEMPDPKLALLQWARKSKLHKNNGLWRIKNGALVQGESYNYILSSWVKSTWNMTLAATDSPSLARTINRVDLWLNLLKESTK